MKVNDKLLTIPFDQYSRQYQVAMFVDQLRSNGQVYKILDVGGYKGKTSQFFPNDDVTVLDVYNIDEPNYIQGSGLDLPFQDGAFDIVVNFDVLEHIAKKDRLKFIDECARVSSSAFFVCAPHQTPENDYAENQLNKLYKSLHNQDHQWLKEHIDNSLPDIPLIEKHLNNNGIYTVRYSSNDITNWLLMQSVIFFNSKYSYASQGVQEINSFYNQNYPYDGGVSEEESYRIILCCSKTSKNMDKISKLFKLKSSTLKLADKLELTSKILGYYTKLLADIDAESLNYRDNFEQAKIDIKTLQTQNEQLNNDLNKLNRLLPIRLMRWLRRKLRVIMRGRS